MWSAGQHLHMVWHKSKERKRRWDWHNWKNTLPDKNNVVHMSACWPACAHPSLSISMTACSSILALGMMPLCLLIYTTLWTSAGTIKIPYDSIGEFAATAPPKRNTQMATRWRKLEAMLLPSGITLVALLVPIALGMYVKRRWPEKAKKILRVGRLGSSLLFFFV